MKCLLLALSVMLAAMAGCTGDDTTTPNVDAAASIDGTGGGIDAPAGTIDAPGGTPDAATACILPTQSITCTDNTPCTNACAGAFCYNFNQVGMRCTNTCTSAAQCPAGWVCNGMGRCRPPN
jgi:hypothetical protein